MPVAEAEDVPEDGDGGRGSRVREPPVEPFVRVLEAFHEEVAEHGVEVVGHLPEDFDAVFDALGLRVLDLAAADGGFEVFGEVPAVGWQEVLVQRDGVGHELDDAGCGRQGKHFVGADAEIAFPR